MKQYIIDLNMAIQTFEAIGSWHMVEILREQLRKIINDN